MSSFKDPAVYSHSWLMRQLNLVGKLQTSQPLRTVIEKSEACGPAKTLNLIKNQSHSVSSVAVLSFYRFPCPFSNLPHFKADGLHPRIGPLLFILIPFFSTSFHSGCSYIEVITIQQSPEGSGCKIQSGTERDLTPIC